MGANIIAPLEYAGTMHGDFFEAWFEKHLLPELPEDVTIILDNASFHRKKRLYEIAQRHKRNIIFLPPYSTELNPIEHFWHWLKKTTADFFKFCSNLNIAISEALQKWIIKFMFFKCFDYNTPVLVWLQIGYFIIQVCFRLKNICPFSSTRSTCCSEIAHYGHD